jgi:hypothetical protein
LASFNFSTKFAVDSSGAHITFPAHEGHTFQLQRSPGLQPGTWGSVGHAVAGNGQMTTLTDPAPPSPDRHFYRLIVLPENH